MIIREVTAEDAAAIAALSHQLGYTISEDQTLQNIHALLQSERHVTFVAVDENVIGWMGVSYTVSVESPPLCEIHGLVIDEQYRNKGIGKLLIEKAKEWSRDKAVGKLRLRCNVKRTETHTFYEYISFAEVKQQKVYEINI
ncbi:MAG TPA: GNAT family N-acetyltransferase [Flavitalea sp.]|nr:GNAT family N-acetyltransferase [Flavitalea sp.]